MGSACTIKDYRNLSVMWKTVSEACNLACDYCYYSTCDGKPGSKINRIDSAILEKFIQEYMKLSRGSAVFTWQEGEPLLAGLVTRYRTEDPLFVEIAPLLLCLRTRVPLFDQMDHNKQVIGINRGT